jgi:hypothetical protein
MSQTLSWEEGRDHYYHPYFVTKFKKKKLNQREVESFIQGHRTGKHLILASNSATRL